MGSDPSQTIGNNGVDVNPVTVSLKAGAVAILKNRNLLPDYRDAEGMAVFAHDEFTLHVDLGLGDSSATVWTGDLTHEDITINAEHLT